MNAIKQLWLKVHNNPVFVTAWTLFAGAFGSEVTTAWTSGHFDFSLQSWQKMAESAAMTAAVALVHLYIIPKNPTMAATIPPDPQVKQVPAALEPINPAAVPVPPAAK